MYKEISIDNWILGGTVFLLIFTLGCFLWFQNEMEYLQPHNTDTELERQHLEKPSDIRQIETPQIELPDASEKNSSDVRNKVDRNPGVSDSSAQQNTVNVLVTVPLAVIK